MTPQSFSDKRSSSGFHVTQTFKPSPTVSAERCIHAYTHTLRSLYIHSTSAPPCTPSMPQYLHLLLLRHSERVFACVFFDGVVASCGAVVTMLAMPPCGTWEAALRVDKAGESDPCHRHHRHPFFAGSVTTTLLT